MAGNDQLLQLILKKTNGLHDHLANGEWEKAARLESERQALIHTCFSDQTEFNDPRKAMQLIQKIIDLDQQSIEMGVDARSELKDSLGKLQRGGQAVRAYQNTQG